jgi:hypothetical protein
MIFFKNQSQQNLPETSKHAVNVEKKADQAALKKRIIGKPNRLNALEVVWKATWIKTFATDADGVATGCNVVQPWTHKEYGMVGHFTKNLLVEEAKHEAFFRFIVERWRKVIQAKFRWMNDPPRYPKVSFLIRFRGEFLEAWAERETLAWISTLPHERRELERLRQQGLSLEEANLEVAKTWALTKDREKRRQDIEQANILYQMAVAARREIQQRGNTLPHPDAWMNQKPPDTSFHQDHGFESADTPLPRAEIKPWSEEEE